MPEPSPLVIIVSLSVNALVNASTQHNSSALALRVALRALFLGSLNPKKQGRFMIAGGRPRAPMGAKEEHQDDACRARERLATPSERGSGRRHPRSRRMLKITRQHASEGMRPKACVRRHPNTESQKKEDEKVSEGCGGFTEETP
jgi:hypothetical protein